MSRRHRLPRGEDMAAEVMRTMAREMRERARHRRRRGRRRGPRIFSKLLKAWLLMIGATFVIVPLMIAGGWFLGPHGVEGLVLTPLTLVVSWALILYFTVFRKPAPPTAAGASSSVALLPAQTDDWLETQRVLLPALAQDHIDSISQRLEQLTPQLRALDAQSPAASELKRLLGEELPELVRGYEKVPQGLRTQPLHGGLTPERQLLEGLQTIDEQIGRIHEQLAASDLHALATHQRYLELKYKRDDDNVE